MDNEIDQTDNESAPMASDARPSFITAATPTSSPQSTGQTLDVRKAQRIIKAFTDDPSWLADPRTSHAANSVFAAASKVVSMNIQLERLNNAGRLSAAQIEADKLDAKDIHSLMPFLTFDQRSSLRDENGNIVFNKNTRELLAQYRQQYADKLAEGATKDIQPKPMLVTLDDGTKVQGVYNPQTGMFKEHVPQSPEKSIESLNREKLKDAYARRRIAMASLADPMKRNKAQIQKEFDRAESDIKAIESASPAPTAPTNSMPNGAYSESVNETNAPAASGWQDFGGYKFRIKSP